MKPDLQMTAYILGRIRALPASQRARWRSKGRVPLLRREAKRLVIAQWLAESPVNPS